MKNYYEMNKQELIEAKKEIEPVLESLKRRFKKLCMIQRSYIDSYNKSVSKKQLGIEYTKSWLTIDEKNNIVAHLGTLKYYSRVHTNECYEWIELIRDVGKDISIVYDEMKDAENKLGSINYNLYENHRLSPYDDFCGSPISDEEIISKIMRDGIIYGILL